MLTSLETAKSRREFVSRMCLAAMAVPCMAAASPRQVTSSQGPSAPLPFNPEGPFDVRLRPVVGQKDYWQQTAHMQAFDRFGRPKFGYQAEAYARREEISHQEREEMWHRVTWKFATVTYQRLTATLYPYSQGFTHESPVTGGVWDLRMDLSNLPHTVQAFAFLQQPFDIQYVFHLVSESWTGIEQLRRIGDTVEAGIEPEAVGDNWFTRPTWEFHLGPDVHYWTGQYRLKLSLAGLTKVGGEWCARLDFDCIVPERLALRLGNKTEIRHMHAHTMGDIEISIEARQLARCFWNHFIIDGNEEIPAEAGVADAVSGVRVWRRQVLLTRVPEAEYEQVTPEIEK